MESADAPPADPSSPPATIALVRDLMFASRVSSTAAQAGTPIKLLRDPALLAAEPGDRLIVDLNLPGAIESAAAWRRLGGGRRTVIGFVSHVDADAIAKAREAGIDQVLARSQFVQRLPALLAPPAR